MTRLLGAILLLLALGSCRTNHLREAIPFNDHYVLLVDSGNMAVFARQDARRGVGVKSKRYYWLRKDSVFSSQGAWDGKLLYGSYTLHRLDGSLEEMGQFSKGMKVGTWHHWDHTGTLRQRSRWRKGRESGKFWIYDEQGRLIQAGKKKEGTLDGILKHYRYGSGDTSGVSHRKVRYRNGEALPETEKGLPFRVIRSVRQVLGSLGRDTLDKQK